MSSKLKKCVLLLFVVSAMLISLVGCQNKSSDESGGESATDTQSSSITEDEDETAVTVEVKTVSTGNVEMDYMVFGKGEKNFVILPGLSVHSVMGLANSVAEAYKDFAEDYTVYLFDRPKQLQEGTTIRDLAASTAEAMKALNIEDAYIFGASQGGMIAQYIAIDYPELVEKMVLGSTLSKQNATFEAVGNEWLALAEEKDENALLEKFVDDIYSKTTLDAYRDVLISSNAGITDEEYERLIIMIKSCMSFDCSEELSSIQCPVLVLGSEGDKVVTAEGSKEIAEALNCEIYLYDASYGHGVYDEAPDYKQRCMDFFEQTK